MHVETSHTLLIDIANPTIPYRDKRKEEQWYDRPLTKGMRFVLSKRECDPYSPRKGFEYEIGIDIGGETIPSSGDQFMRIAYEDPEGVITFYSERYIQMAETKKEKKHFEDCVAFQKALWNALSEPINDYNSIFNDCADYDCVNASRTLFRLYKMGKVTLADIRQALVEQSRLEKLEREELT